MKKTWQWLYYVGNRIEYTENHYTTEECTNALHRGARILGRILESEIEVQEEKTGWVNVEPAGPNGVRYVSHARIFDTEQQAQENAKANGYPVLRTVQITWKE